MVRRHRVVAKAIAEMPRDALGHPSRVHEHQRRLVLTDEHRQPVVVLLPDLVRHHRLERRAGDFQVEVHGAPMPLVDNRAVARRLTCTHEISRHLFNRFLRRRQANPQQRPFGHLLQTLER